jgi:hypothetical protein
MTDLFAPSVYEWYSGEFTEPIEGQPDPGPGYEPPVVPDQDGAQGEEFYVAVSSFGPGTPGAVRGIFWGAVIESLTEADRGMGGNRLSISVPLTAHNMRVWGAPSLEVDQQGEILYHLPAEAWPGNCSSDRTSTADPCGGSSSATKSASRTAVHEDQRRRHHRRASPRTGSWGRCAGPATG